MFVETVDEEAHMLFDLESENGLQCSQELTLFPGGISLDSLSCKKLVDYACVDRGVWYSRDRSKPETLLCSGEPGRQKKNLMI